MGPRQGPPRMYFFLLCLAKGCRLVCSGARVQLTWGPQDRVSLLQERTGKEKSGKDPIQAGRSLGQS